MPIGGAGLRAGAESGGCGDGVEVSDWLTVIVAVASGGVEEVEAGALMA